MGLVYFLVYLFLEILFSYEFAKIFTPLGLFIEVLVTMLTGAYIIRMLPFSFSESMLKVLRREMTEEEFLSVGIFKFIGAVLLIVPGVFSDILGALFLFEPFARWIAKKFLPQQNNFYTYTNTDNDVIDVEIIEERKEIKP